MILTLILSICGAGAVFAADSFERIKMKPVKVGINSGGAYLDGLQTEQGETYVPLEEVAKSLRALVSKDSATGKISIFKPNVQIVLGNTVETKSCFLGICNKEVITSFFGKVTKGGEQNFSVFVQIENMPFLAKSYKLTIIDPNGELLISKETTDTAESWFTTEVNIKFSVQGKYKVRFLIKPDGENDYSVVSEKTFEYTEEKAEKAEK